jgi:transcription initiation factor IIE alpha subunit
MRKNPEFMDILFRKWPQVKEDLCGMLQVVKKNNLYIGWKLKCPKCKFNFGVERLFIGVITCPYCGEYIEG